MVAKLRCIIIDDEPFALNILADDIERIPMLEGIGKFTNPLAAMSLIQQGKADLLFLDIQMPVLLGTQFLRTLSKPPMVIFTTAYPQYAVESYELNVVDYLLKPIRFERLLQASNKACERYHQIASSPDEMATDTYFFVYSEHKEIKIYHHDVVYIEGMKDYVKIFLDSRPGKPILTRLNVKAIETRLDTRRFCRVHQSYIVPLNRITAFQKTRILLGTIAIPVGGRYAEDFLALYRQA
jgi:DNA-binding LytR/AlgR family response regulator